uniref:NADH-ubiquinone oxidoreductase chain 5 n=1 Tax=Notospermus geniculatus TaxID=416868 RepID=A0A4Y5RUZ8_9BILA|nr:NADH dehydrogenase subunit 5 [Notospermus geniculatus]QCZ36416.1 NADH dehydrogenase subunit 5 [Notospermus geniculatus]
MAWWSFYVSGSLSVFFFLCFLFMGWSLTVFLLESFVLVLSWEIGFLAGVSVELSLVFDWVSVSFGCVVLLISACVLLFSCEYMSGEVFLPRFSWLVFLFVLSMSFVIFIPNLVAILLGWDGLGLVSFLLVIYYQNFKSLAGGLLTVLMNRVGDVMILLSIGLLCVEGCYGIFYFSDTKVLGVVCACLLVAGMTKSAQVPFSSWLPAAMAAPTPVSALVHSSTLVTAGVFLLVRFFGYLSEIWWFKPALLVVAVLTMLMAGISASLEGDMKKIIALSTLSQLGVMMASLGMGAWKLALFHLYTHAMFKALLFLCAGAMIHRLQHGQDLRSVGMVWGRVPVIVSCFHISNLALCGAPFLAGFYSKDAILEGSLYWETGWLILLMAFLATGMTVSYSIRLSFFVLWSSFNFYSLHSWGDEKLSEVVPMTVLVFGAVGGGSCLLWLLFYGGEPVCLSFFSKIFTLLVLVSGGGLGWFFSGAKGLVGSGFWVDLKSYFGFTYMWFLVHLSSQGWVEGGVKVGASVLYCGDRGWFELLGGSGLFLLAGKVIGVGQGYSFNSVLVYMSIVFFVLFCFLAPFLVWGG